MSNVEFDNEVSNIVFSIKIKQRINAISTSFRPFINNNNNLIKH